MLRERSFTCFKYGSNTCDCLAGTIQWVHRECLTGWTDMGNWQCKTCKQDYKVRGLQTVTCAHLLGPPALRYV